MENTSTRLPQQNPPGGDPPQDPPPAKPPVAAAAKKGGKIEWLPYKGKSDLPMNYVKGKDRKGKDGRVEGGRVTHAGSERYALRPTHGDFPAYELLAFYRNGKGVARRLVATLKTFNRGPRGTKDRRFFEELKSKGVPIIHD